MDTFIALLIVAFSGFAVYVVIRLWHDYDLAERLALKARRMLGKPEIRLNDPIDHRCLTWVKTRQELLDHSTFCGIQETLHYDTHDYELRTCIHCGSTFSATRLPKFSTPHDPKHH